MKAFSPPRFPCLFRFPPPNTHLHAFFPLLSTVITLSPHPFLPHTVVFHRLWITLFLFLALSFIQGDAARFSLFTTFVEKRPIAWNTFRQSFCPKTFPRFPLPIITNIDYLLFLLIPKRKRKVCIIWDGGAGGGKVEKPFPRRKRRLANRSKLRCRALHYLCTKKKEWSI